MLVAPRSGTGIVTYQSIGFSPVNWTRLGLRVYPGCNSSTNLVVPPSNWPTRNDLKLPVNFWVLVGFPKPMPGRSMTKRVGLNSMTALGWTPAFVLKSNRFLPASNFHDANWPASAGIASRQKLNTLKSKNWNLTILHPWPWTYLRFSMGDVPIQSDCLWLHCVAIT